MQILNLKLSSFGAVDPWYYLACRHFIIIPCFQNHRPP